MERPLLFVDYNNDGKLFINPDAADLLTNLEEEIAIIGVVGIPGAGKSFTLNELRPSNDGFEVASDSRPLTQGMWLLDTLIPQASGHKALLLDCEGFNRHSGRGRARRHLVYLSLLLSSVIINTQIGGRIQKENISRLSLVAGVTDEIRVRETQPESDYKSVFPTFVWLIRDFIGGIPVQQTPDQYLEKALMDEDGRDTKKMGKRVKELFPGMHCYTLPRPAKEERHLQNLSQTKNASMRPCYRAKRKKFLEFVSSKTCPKMVDGMVLTGPMLVGITKQFIDDFNKDDVPVISSIWKNAADHINLHPQCLEYGLEEYKTSLKTRLGGILQQCEVQSKEVAMEDETWAKSARAGLKKAHDGACDDALAYANTVDLGHCRLGCIPQLKALMKAKYEALQVQLSTPDGFQTCHQSFIL